MLHLPWYRHATDFIPVSRLVHFLRLHLVGRIIANVVAPDDSILFGKAGTTAAAFTTAALGKKVRARALRFPLRVSLLTWRIGHVGRLSGKVLLVSH